MSDELYEKWKVVVAKVAKKVARTFPEVEEEDLYQDLFLHIFESKLEKQSDDFAFRTLELLANDIAWRYRRESLAANGQYLYRPMDVRKIVSEYLFNEEYWKKSIVIDEQIATNGDRVSETLDFEDRVAVYADMAKAFSQLPESYQDIVERVYRDGETFDNNSPERKRLDRAIDRMTDYLNYSRRNHG